MFIKKNYNISDDWETSYKSKDKFLDFIPQNLTKKHLMAQYWFDKINAWRNK